MPTTAARPRGAALGPRWSLAVTAVRRHWLFAVLLVAGLVLRILVQAAYRPALFFTDTIKYLYGAYPGDDPPGYQFFLKAFLSVGNLDMVAAFQHLLGLGMAVALYALMLRRGAPRWLAALATAPVLLDGYQLQIEQMVMPDALFEALLVAGVVVLLWRSTPRLWMLAVAGVLLGCTGPVWQPGEILLLPALAYAAIMASGWRARTGRTVLIGVAFLLPILAVSARNDVVLRHFSLAPNAAGTIYGRMAYAADCATLKLPSYERPLCLPHAEAVRLGPDNLDHSAQSPLKHLVLPPGRAQHNVATNFSDRVLEQQPLRVIGSVLADAIKLFEVHRVTSPGDTPISRWQFQTTFPQFPPYVTIHDGQMRFVELDDAGQPVVLGNGLNFGGGPPKVVTPVARFLRGYQLDGGFTPGPLLLFALITGLIGSAFLLIRRSCLDDRSWQAARACCFVLCSGVAVLLLSDVFEFSWRYQLPALVTLPPAGALGITVMIGYAKRLRLARSAAGQPVTAAAPAPGVHAPGATADGATGGAAQSPPPDLVGEGRTVPEQPTGR